MDQNTVLQVLENIIDILPAAWHLGMIICYVAGFAFVITGFIRITVGTGYNRSQGLMARQGTLGGVTSIVVGLLCLNLPQVMDVFAQSIFAQDSLQSLSYEPTGGGDFRVYLKFAVLSVSLIGLFGLLKGIFTLKRCGDNPQELPQALTYIIGGILAVNNVQLIHLLGRTLGGPFGDMANLF